MCAKNQIEQVIPEGGEDISKRVLHNYEIK